MRNIALTGNFGYNEVFFEVTITGFDFVLLNYTKKRNVVAQVLKMYFLKRLPLGE